MNIKTLIVTLAVVALLLFLLDLHTEFIEFSFEEICNNLENVTNEL